MAGSTEDIDVTLPSGEQITATIPAGMSDVQAKAYMQQKRPDLFQQAKPQAAGAPAQQSEPGFTKGFSDILGYSSPDIGWKDFGKQTLHNLGNFFGSTIDDYQKSFAKHPAATMAMMPFYPEHVAARGIEGMANAVEKSGHDLMTPGKRFYGAGEMLGSLGQVMLASDAPEKLKAPSKVADTVKTAADLKSAAGNDAIPFRQALQATGHDILTKTADTAKQKLWDAHNQVSQRVGALKNDIAASDYAKGEPGIVVSDLLPKIDELGANYKAAGGKLPHFDAATAAITSRGTPVLTFEEAANLRSAIGDLWNKAAEGTRDSAAVEELRDALSGKLQQRANDLGHAKTFDAYNTLWRTLKQYEQKGPMGQLLNAPDGYTFYNILRDPKNGAALARTFNSLQDFGLPKDYAQSLRTNGVQLHDYLRNASTNMGISGRLKTIARHPVAGTVGGVAGNMVGGWPGGMLGTLASGQVADTLSGIKAVRDAGGVPTREGEMADAAQVKPSGNPVNRPAAPDPKMQADLISALQSQGFSKQAATAAAIKAIRANPQGDFGVLFNQAVRR